MVVNEENDFFEHRHVCIMDIKLSLAIPPFHCVKKVKCSKLWSLNNLIYDRITGETRGNFALCLRCFPPCIGVERRRRTMEVEDE